MSILCNLNNVVKQTEGENGLPGNSVNTKKERPLSAPLESRSEVYLFFSPSIK